MNAPMGRAAAHEPLTADAAERWSKFGRGDVQLYVNLVGLEVEEVRTDYCRMRLPFRPELNQAAGSVHGGAIATLLDSVVVPAVGSAYPRDARFSTIDMHVQFLSALMADDAIAEGWVVKRGKTTVFCEAEARAASSGTVIARSLLTYHVSVPR